MNITTVITYEEQPLIMLSTIIYGINEETNEIIEIIYNEIYTTHVVPCTLVEDYQLYMLGDLNGLDKAWQENVEIQPCSGDMQT